MKTRINRLLQKKIEEGSCIFIPKS